MHSTSSHAAGRRRRRQRAHPQRPERLQFVCQLPVQRLDPLIQLSDRGALWERGAGKLGDSSRPRACKAAPDNLNLMRAPAGATTTDAGPARRSGGPGARDGGGLGCRSRPPWLQQRWNSMHSLLQRRPRGMEPPHLHSHAAAGAQQRRSTGCPPPAPVLACTHQASDFTVDESNVH